jgi:hypothetical protein
MRSVSKTGHRRASKMINKLCGKLSATGGFKTSDPVRVGIILGTRNFNKLPRLSDKRLAVNSMDRAQSSDLDRNAE